METSESFSARVFVYWIKECKVEEKHTAYSTHAIVSWHTASASCSCRAALVSGSAVLNLSGTRLSAGATRNVALSGVRHELAGITGGAATVRSIDSGAAVGASRALEGSIPQLGMK